MAAAHPRFLAPWAELADLAAAEGREDPVALLGVPLRQGRAAAVTVVVAEEFGGLERLPPALRQHLHARVVLGSDYSFPPADMEPLALLRSAGLSAVEIEAIAVVGE